MRDMGVSLLIHAELIWVLWASGGRPFWAGPVIILMEVLTERYIDIDNELGLGRAVSSDPYHHHYHPFTLSNLWIAIGKGKPYSYQLVYLLQLNSVDIEIGCMLPFLQEVI